MEPSDPLPRSAAEAFGPPGEAGDDPARRGMVAYQRSGDRAALAESLLACLPELDRELRRLQVPPQDRADLVQECFTVVIRRSADFDASRRLQPWLLGVLGNLARAQRRSRARRRTQPLLDDEAVGAGTDPVEWLDLEAWRARVREVLPELPQRYRTVLHHHLLDGRTPAEIATQLQRPSSTVRTQLERGLRELRRRLPAPLLLGLMAVQAAGQDQPVPPSGSATPASVPPRLLAAAGVLVLGFGAAVLWWPEPAPGSTLTGSVGSEVVRPADSAGGPAAVDRAPSTPATDAAGEVRVQLLEAPGIPAAGVAVILEPSLLPGEPVVRSQFRWQLARTDTQGEAVFRGVPPGPAALRVNDVGIARSFPVTAGAQLVSVEVAPVGRVEVTVRAADEQPVAGAQVWLGGTTGKLSPGYLAGRTGRDGVLRVPVFLPVVYVWARVDGHAASRIGGPVTVAGDAALTVRVGEPAAAVAVRVEDAVGQPIAGALVAGSNPQVPARPPAYGRTDARGIATLDGLLPGPIGLSALAPRGVKRLEVEGAALPAGAAAPPPVPLVLGAGSSIRGRIAGLDPSVAAEFRVVSRHASIDCPFNGTAAVPAADGTFELTGLFAGGHHVAVMRRGESAPRSVHRVQTEAGGVAHLETEVDDARSTCRIRVVDGDGVPLGGYWVRTMSALPIVGRRHRRSARADADGFARIKLLGNAPQILSVHRPHESEAGATAETPATQPLAVLETEPVVLADMTLVVPREQLAQARVTGRLSAPHRLPPFGKDLRLLSRTASQQIAVQEDGRFAADGVPPGVYSLLFLVGEGLDRYHHPVAEVRVASVGVVDLGLLPDPGLGVLVVAHAESGARSPAMFEVQDAAGGFVALGVVQVGERKEYRLPSGRFSVRYASASAVGAVRYAVVIAGRRAEVTLEGVAGQPCRIQVQSSERMSTATPLFGRLSQEGSGTSCRLLLTPHAGRMSWSQRLDLVPGRYRVEFETAWGQRGDGEFEVVVGGGARRFPFRLR